MQVFHFSICPLRERPSGKKLIAFLEREGKREGRINRTKFKEVSERERRKEMEKESYEEGGEREKEKEG